MPPLLLCISHPPPFCVVLRHQLTVKVAPWEASPSVEKSASKKTSAKKTPSQGTTTAWTPKAICLRVYKDIIEAEVEDRQLAEVQLLLSVSVCLRLCVCVCVCVCLLCWVWRQPSDYGDAAVCDSASASPHFLAPPIPPLYSCFLTSHPRTRQCTMTQSRTPSASTKSRFCCFFLPETHTSSTQRFREEGFT